MSSFEDDDVAVIALWIIAIGFFILAVDKTTKLSNKPETNKPIPVPCPPCNQSDDQQFDQIQKQLEQLKNGLTQLKKICKTDE